MRFVYPSFYLLLLIIISCNNFEKQQHYDEKKITNNDSLQRNDDIIRKFSLPYSTSLLEDSTGLIFYSLNEFDTTILLHCKSNGNDVVGIFYYVVPRYRGLYDISDPKRELIRFNGLSFKIADKKWLDIKKRALSIVDRKDTAFNPPACADCPFYYLSHCGQWSNSNIQNIVLFDDFSKVIKDSLINHYMLLQNKR